MKVDESKAAMAAGHQATMASITLMTEAEEPLSEADKATLQGNLKTMQLADDSKKTMKEAGYAVGGLGSLRWIWTAAAGTAENTAACE